MSLFEHYHTIICGAGPVGLLSANLLGQAGLSVLVLERLETPVPWSRAIGISPPSLEILASIGLDHEFIEKGIAISDVSVHGSQGFNRLIGRVSFANIPSRYPFILSLPQITTEEILARGLDRWPQVTVLREAALCGLSQGPSGITVNFQQFNGANQTVQSVQANWLLGCDGLGSTVRQLAGIGWADKRYNDSFVMGDFIQELSKTGSSKVDSPELGHEAHLFFTPQGAVESFPLPNGIRRWIVQTPKFIESPNSQLIRESVLARSGINLPHAALQWQSPFGVRRALASRYRRGRVCLLGDAAHLMSPIGGQGMNTGFADSADLIPLIISTSDPQTQAKQLRHWEHQRRQAFRIAAGRASRSMKLGTVRGPWQSLIRNGILSLMLNGPWRHRVPIDYAMLSIPRPRGTKQEL